MQLSQTPWLRLNVLSNVDFFPLYFLLKVCLNICTDMARYFKVFVIQRIFTFGRFIEYFCWHRPQRPKCFIDFSLCSAHVMLAFILGNLFI